MTRWSIPLFVVDTDDPDQIRKDADAFFSAWCPGSDDDDAEKIKSDFDSETIDLWWLGARASGLVQVYDLVAPLDPDGRAAQYLEACAASPARCSRTGTT